MIKEAEDRRQVGWHQDLTYWGLDDAAEVTAWVALSPSTQEAGAMRYIPGTHRRAIVEHVDTFSADNLLSRGQEIAVEVDESEARATHAVFIRNPEGFPRIVNLNVDRSETDTSGRRWVVQDEVPDLTVRLPVEGVPLETPRLPVSTGRIRQGRGR